MDASLVHALLSPWLESWSQPPEPMSGDDTGGGPLGCELEFRLNGDGPNLNELLWLLDALPNGHVAAQTVSLASSYTGVRSKRYRFTAPAKRPASAVLTAATQAASRYAQALTIESERVVVAKDFLKRQSAGAKDPQESQGSKDGPGWLVLLEHGSPDLHSMLLVAALGGDLNRTICGMSQVDARCLTLRV
jgi:hypothetical protein